MDCSLSGSSVHGIFQVRVLEWIAISFSRGSSQPRNRTQVSHIAGRHFLGKPKKATILNKIKKNNNNYSITIVGGLNIKCWNVQQSSAIHWFKLSAKQVRITDFILDHFFYHPLVDSPSIWVDSIWTVLYGKLRFPSGGSAVKASACNVGDLGSIPRSGRSPGERKGNPLQYSCLENAMDGGAWWATVHGVAKSWTRLSDFTHSLTHDPVTIFLIFWGLFLWALFFSCVSCL